MASAERVAALASSFKGLRAACPGFPCGMHATEKNQGFFVAKRQPLG
jgi:hypothetical protein